MNTPVSVVIVSRDRPKALARCLTGVGQLYHHPYEVVVVTDPEGRDAVAAHPLGDRVKVVAFDAPNISAARNAGIAASAGEVVAFIDDDAVPEPSWLDHLVAPLAAGMAEVAGGHVLGRNGISLQWGARSVDASGRARALPIDGCGPVVPVPPPGEAVKTEGTNMAVRRKALLAAGGFDSRYRFYLDETELNLRLGRAGRRTALVPLAQVHHGFLESPRRRFDRLPINLYDIGRSSEIFWADHLPPADIPTARAALVAEQRRRLVLHMVRGTCEPADMQRLLATLDEGLAAGRATAVSVPAERQLFGAPPPDFCPLHQTRPEPSMAFLGGPERDRAELLAQAEAIVEAGGRATLVLLSPGSARHRVEFTDRGIWLQSGGRFGRADRSGPLPRLQGLAARIEQERRRVAAVRLPKG